MKSSCVRGECGRKSIRLDEKFVGKRKDCGSLFQEYYMWTETYCCISKLPEVRVREERIIASAHIFSLRPFCVATS